MSLSIDEIKKSEIFKKFKKVTFDPLPAGAIPLYDIMAGDNALSFILEDNSWESCPSINIPLNCPENFYKDKELTKLIIKMDRRCVPHGFFYADSIEDFDKLFVA